MNKNIIIVGGGISGLSVLHYLRQKYEGQADVTIKLLERESEPGGMIRTVHRDGIQFETGPNGFLDNNPSALALAEELGLAAELITANPTSKIRYICMDDTLYALPANLLALLKFAPMNVGEKLRALQEFFIPKGQDPDETVHEFGTRRLGQGFAKYFFDPMVSGIFGGDSRELNLKYAFPRLFEMEQEFGSLFKRMLVLPASKRVKPQLWSFKTGMGRLIEKLIEKHRDCIETGVLVSAIFREENGYTLEAEGKKYFANEVILSVPAYAASDLIVDMDDALGQWLSEISYASIAVVGLSYAKEQFSTVPQGFGREDQTPKGFGYLRLGHEGKEVLGTVFNSNIFSQRSREGQIMFQVMLGGARHPDTIRKSDEELIDLAKAEIKAVLNVQGEPKEQFLSRWGKAIPQYDRSYPQAREAIDGLMVRYPGLYLLSNYLDGVSVNDCIANAKVLSEKVLQGSTEDENKVEKIFQ